MIASDKPLWQELENLEFLGFRQSFHGILYIIYSNDNS